MHDAATDGEYLLSDASDQLRMLRISLEGAYHRGADPSAVETAWLSLHFLAV